MKDEMTSIERVKAAYSLREPDRVPVFPMVTYASGTPIGYSLREYCCDVEKMVKGKGQLHLQKWLDCDFVLSYVDVWVFAEAVGVRLDFPENNTPNPVESPVKSSEDVEKLEVPDPKRDGRLPIIVEGIDCLRKRVGGKVARRRRSTRECMATT